MALAAPMTPSVTIDGAAAAERTTALEAARSRAAIATRRVPA